jgi:hypothetical protein
MNFNGGDGILEMVTWVHDADVPGAAGTGDWLEAGSGAAPPATTEIIVALPYSLAL